MRRLTATHLDIVYDWEVQVEHLKKLDLLQRKVLVGQQLDQVTKVVATAPKQSSIIYLYRESK